MKVKIVEVPVADKTQAEKVVNKALATIASTATINNQVVLDNRRLAIFYTEAAASPTPTPNH